MNIDTDEMRMKKEEEKTNGKSIQRTSRKYATKYMYI